MNKPAIWTISGEWLLDAFRRAAAGENPELIYIEYVSKARVENLND